MLGAAKCGAGTCRIQSSENKIAPRMPVIPRLNCIVMCLSFHEYHDLMQLYYTIGLLMRYLKKDNVILAVLQKPFPIFPD